MTVYTPDSTLRTRVSRRLTPHLARRGVPMTLTQPTFSFSFDDVPDSVAATALPMLDAKGWRSTLYVASDLMGRTNHHGRNMDAGDLRAALATGHEIAAHSHGHANLAQLGSDDVRRDLAENDAQLSALGACVRSFAYPYGEADPRLKRICSERYASARGIRAGVHRRRVDLAQMRCFALYDSTVDDIVETIATLGDAPVWMSVFTHDVREAPTRWGCTPQTLQRVIDAVADRQLAVRTIGDVVDDLTTRKLAA